MGLNRDPGGSASYHIELTKYGSNNFFLKYHTGRSQEALKMYGNGTGTRTCRVILVIFYDNIKCTYFTFGYECSYWWQLVIGRTPEIFREAEHCIQS